jgi:hypothetical protein
MNFSVKSRIYCISDGAASQCKKKKKQFIIILCYQKDYFGMDAECHFFTTSNGKCQCDGIGGTIKRLARKASLKTPYEDEIMTLRQFQEWAVVRIPSVAFDYCGPFENHSKRMTMLEGVQEG